MSDLDDSIVCQCGRKFQSIKQLVEHQQSSPHGTVVEAKHGETYLDGSVLQDGSDEEAKHDVNLCVVEDGTDEEAKQDEADVYQCVLQDGIDLEAKQDRTGTDVDGFILQGIEEPLIAQRVDGRGEHVTVSVLLSALEQQLLYTDQNLLSSGTGMPSLFDEQSEFILTAEQMERNAVMARLLIYEILLQFAFECCALN